MNKQFADEQIRLYARQFEEGDAIYNNTKNKWECFQLKESAKESLGLERLREFYKHLANQIANGRYKFLTPQNYKLQGGEKIIWLGENSSARTFGKVYTTSVGLILDEISVVCTDNHGWVIKPELNDWAIIPSYEQVKDLNKTTATEKVNQTTKETKRKQSIYEQVANEHNITKEELSFILDECDNGRRKYIIDCLIALRNKWHESN